MTPYLARAGCSILSWFHWGKSWIPKLYFRLHSWADGCPPPREVRRRSIRSGSRTPRPRRCRHKVMVVEASAPWWPWQRPRGVAAGTLIGPPASRESWAREGLLAETMQLPRESSSTGFGCPTVSSADNYPYCRSLSSRCRCRCGPGAPWANWTQPTRLQG